MGQFKKAIMIAHHPHLVHGTLRVVNGNPICWLVQKNVKTGKTYWDKPQARSKNDSLRLYLARAVTKMGHGVFLLTGLLLDPLFSGYIKTGISTLVQCASVRSLRVPKCLPYCLEN